MKTHLTKDDQNKLQIQEQKSPLHRNFALNLVVVTWQTVQTIINYQPEEYSQPEGHKN